MLNIESFEEGVEQATRILLLSSERPQGAAASLIETNGFEKNCLLPLGFSFALLWPEALVDTSRKDAVSLDLLRWGTAEHLERGINLPEVLKNWLVEYLLGHTSHPPRKAGRGSSFGSNLVVYYTVRALVAGGMRATRNETSPAESACDAVAEALRRLRLKPKSYERVRAIWHEVGGLVDPRGNIEFRYVFEN